MDAETLLEALKWVQAETTWHNGPRDEYLDHIHDYVTQVLRKVQD